MNTVVPSIQASSKIFSMHARFIDLKRSPTHTSATPNHSLNRTLCSAG